MVQLGWWLKNTQPDRDFAVAKTAGVVQLQVERRRLYPCSGLDYSRFIRFRDMIAEEFKRQVISLRPDPAASERMSRTQKFCCRRNSCANLIARPKRKEQPVRFRN